LEGETGSLIFDALKYLDNSTNRPGLVVVEQVPGSLRKKHKRLWSQAVKKLQNASTKLARDFWMLKTLDARREGNV
jgi:site-specific DNA-cytosine methylase